MSYNEFESKSQGTLKILAHIDNRALLERMYDVSCKYIVAYNFNLEDKTWDNGTYYKSFKEALEDFTARTIKDRYYNEYLKNNEEMKKLRNDFRKNVRNDLKLQEFFKEKDPSKNFESIRVAGVILGRYDLQNLQRENGNLDGEKQEYPFSKEQIKMIDRYYELEQQQEELDMEIENDMEEEMEN